MSTIETTERKRPMTSYIPLFVICLCVASFGAGAWIHSLTTPDAPTTMAAISDVRQVITALNTLAKPQRYDFDPTVKITVQGDGIVRVHLETKRDVKFEAKGRDLEGAIADLSSQAREVASLKIWPKD